MAKAKIYLFSERQKSRVRKLLQNATRKKQIIPHKKCDICSYDIEMLNKEKEALRNRFDHSIRKRYPLSAHHYHYSKPYDVWWLCDVCHYTLHRAQQHFQCACLNLSYAKEITKNYLAWGSIDSYEEFVIKEKKYIRQQLKALAKQKKDLIRQFKALNIRYL